MRAFSMRPFPNLYQFLILLLIVRLQVSVPVDLSYAFHFFTPHGICIIAFVLFSCGYKF